MFNTTAFSISLSIGATLKSAQLPLLDSIVINTLIASDLDAAKWKLESASRIANSRSENSGCAKYVQAFHNFVLLQFSILLKQQERVDGRLKPPFTLNSFKEYETVGDEGAPPPAHEISFGPKFN
jgi:hypothetical protein